MASFSNLVVLAMACIPLALSKDAPLQDIQPLNIAIEEMQRASYFAFIVLLNMAPRNKIPSNITFLMPNNRILSRTVIPKNDVLDFLLMHSIPAPLGFDALRHFPNGSMIPSSKPMFMLNVSNNGWRNFFLNGVKIVSPNVCVSGFSIRCHGIDSVLNETLMVPGPTTDVAPPPAFPPSLGGAHFNPTLEPGGLNPTAKNSGSFCQAFLSKWVLLAMLLVFLLSFS